MEHEWPFLLKYLSGFGYVPLETRLGVNSSAGCGDPEGKRGRKEWPKWGPEEASEVAEDNTLYHVNPSLRSPALRQI